MKAIQTLITLVVYFGINAIANAQLPKALVINLQVDGVKTSSAAVTATLRIELDKTKRYATYDKTDLDIDKLELSKSINECTSVSCLSEVGEKSGMEKVFTGSVINLGNKIAVTIKMIDVKTQAIEKVQVGEFIVLDAEIQNMIRITLNDMLGIQSEKQIIDNLVHFKNVEPVPTQKVNNSGPRFGISMVGGEIAHRLSDKEINGGYEVSPIMSQIGYQFEGQYLSSGDLSALGEFLFMFTGLDQQMFIPSMTVLNGFRLNSSGWEIAFGPSFRVQKKAQGYYDETGQWHLAHEWTDAMNPNPFEIKTMIDRRGNPYINTAWVWAIGKTFRSGYLNIPVNAFFSKSKDGWFTGLSFGFNIKSRKS